MGLQTRHDRLRRELRGLEEELEEARRLKSWYERCLSELDPAPTPSSNAEPEEHEVPQGVRVEIAESPVTSVGLPQVVMSLAETLPDAASDHTESIEHVGEERRLVVAETEVDEEQKEEKGEDGSDDDANSVYPLGSGADGGSQHGDLGNAVQMEDVDLNSGRTSPTKEAIVSRSPASEPDSEGASSYDKIEHEDVEREVELD